MTLPVYFRSMRSLALTALALLGAATTLPVARAQNAAPQTVYTIEIIVFRNTSGGGGPEDWSAKSVARGPDTPESPFTGRFVQAIPASKFQLNGVEARLRNTANYSPIAHFAWQQTASSWGSRAGFTVTKLAGDVPGLSGIVFLERGNYLHLGMALNYQSSNPPPGLGADPGTVFNLNESRRVKFDQLNYYDHPAFGVIALVTPANRSTGGR
jgi:hypothetical protein